MKKITSFLAILLSILCCIVLSACGTSTNIGTPIQTVDEQSDTDDEPIVTKPSTFEKCFVQTDETDKFQYWLYTPENATENMPLIIYLHGGSGKGDDLDLLVQDGFPKFLKDGLLGNVPAYVIIPQLQTAYKGWTDIKTSVRFLIEYAIENYKINANKVSLTGHSMGGTGTWGIATAFPSLFSCIMPMSGSVKNTSANISALSDMPVWAFVGSADTIVKPQSSEAFITALSQTNSKAKITVLEDATHFDVPSLAYLSTEYNVIDWLIAQTR